MLDRFLKAVFSQYWRVGVITAALFLAAAEIGYRLGLRLHRTHDQARKAQIGGIQGAVLGLLALLLAFTFSMSTSHYESRRELVLQEANSIGTTYLRMSLLPEPHQSSLKAKLRQYVDRRLELFDAGENVAAQEAAEREAAELQRQMWDEGTATAASAPGPLAAIFLASLNQTIDLDAARHNAMRNHVPGAVWLLLLIVSVCGCYTTAYSAGASGARNHFSSCLLPLLIAVVVTLVADLDRPRGGLIQISPQPLVDLKESMESG